MGNNSNAITVLCSHLCVGAGVEPLEPREWALVAQKLLEAKREPKDIFDFSSDDYKTVFGFDEIQIERYKRLIDRNASLVFEVEKLNAKGIYIVTRADKNYPTYIKKKLGQQSPPLFYYCGDIEIANDNCIGFVGSREIEDSDSAFTKKIVSICLKEGFSIVSGGAKGVDSTAAEVVLEKGGVAIEYLSDGMNRKIKDGQVLQRIRDERLLLLSAVNPDAGFSVGTAMQRNKYIYSQSLGTVVVRSDFNKGGTWAGAVENLRHKRCHTFCWNNSNYKGNIELIKLGAIPIGDEFDPNEAKKPLHSEQKEQDSQQMSMFDALSGNK